MDKFCCKCEELAEYQCGRSYCIKHIPKDHYVRELFSKQSSLNSPKENAE